MRKVIRADCSNDVRPDGEETDFKELFDPTGPALLFLKMEMAFEAAGYRIRKAEASPHDPPVTVLRLTRGKAPRFSDDTQFVQQVRLILESVAIRPRKADLITEQNGDRILVSFLWQPLLCDNGEVLPSNPLRANIH